jgi:hypothetical protein
MTTILGINTIAFGLLCLIWSKNGWHNTLIKFSLFSICGANLIQWLMAMGYVVRK